MHLPPGLAARIQDWIAIAEESGTARAVGAIRIQLNQRDLEWEAACQPLMPSRKQ